MKFRVLRVNLTFVLMFFPAEVALAEPNSLRLAPGARGEIALRENPTTGYAWRVNAEKSANMSIVRLEDLGFAPPTTSEGAPRLLGAPGVHKWAVKALAPGSAKILFVLERPFEKGRQPVRTQDVDVTVTGH